MNNQNVFKMCTVCSGSGMEQRWDELQLPCDSCDAFDKKYTNKNSDLDLYENFLNNNNNMCWLLSTLVDTQNNNIVLKRLFDEYQPIIPYVGNVFIKHVRSRFERYAHSRIISNQFQKQIDQQSSDILLSTITNQRSANVMKPPSFRYTYAMNQCRSCFKRIDRRRKRFLVYNNRRRFKCDECMRTQVLTLMRKRTRESSSISVKTHREDYRLRMRLYWLKMCSQRQFEQYNVPDTEAHLDMFRYVHYNRNRNCYTGLIVNNVFENVFENKL
jgi:hypothetical protein